MRIRFAVLPFVLVSFTLVAGGCSPPDDGSDNPNMPADDVEVADLSDEKADALGLVGRFTRVPSAGKRLASLELGADKRFGATYRASCAQGACGPTEGTYLLSHSPSGATKYLRLMRGDVLVAR